VLNTLNTSHVFFFSDLENVAKFYWYKAEKMHFVDLFLKLIKETELEG
jgi:hypothetical protein